MTAAAERLRGNSSFEFPQRLSRGIYFPALRFSAPPTYLFT